MIIKKQYFGFILLLALSFFLFVGKNAILHLYGIDKLIKLETITASYIDFFVTIALFSIIFYRYKTNIFQLHFQFVNRDINKLQQNIALLVGIIGVSIMLIYVKEPIYLIINGISRQEAVDLLDGSSVFKVLFGKSFVYILVFVFISKFKNSVKFVYFFGFLLSVISFSSRSDISIVLFLFVIINLINFNYESFKSICKYFTFAIFVVLFITAFVQNRVLESQFMGPFKPVEDLFLYGSYSLVLAERAIYYSSEGLKMVFPYFGYLTEYILVKLELASYVVDSKFISQFVLFFSDIRQHAANVAYPWWAWFFGAYSYVGIIFFKPIYIFLLFIISLKSKSYTLVVFMIFWGLYYSFNKFPLISIEGYITLLCLLSFELLIRFKKKNI